MNRRLFAGILALALVVSAVPVLPAAAEETETTATEETMASTEETTAPTEETTAPSEETTEPSEETTEPTGETTEQETTAPTEETAAPTEAPTEAPADPPTEVSAEVTTEASAGTFAMGPGEVPAEPVLVDAGKWTEGITEYSYEAYQVPAPKARSLDGYLDVDAAVSEFRGLLKQRVTEFTIQVYSTGEPMIALSLYYLATAHNGNPVEGDYIKYHVRQIQEGSRYFISGSEYYCTLNYTADYYTTAAQEEELTPRLDSVMGQLNLTGMTDYQKIRTIYDYITGNVTYDYEHLESDPSYKPMYSAYAALMHKTCVCQGYANLFYRMALTAGIDCRIIDGIGNGGAHAWNIVRLDGVYYDLDSTWDAGSGMYGIPYEFFLRCDANFGDHTRSEQYSTPAFYSQYPMSPTDYLVPTDPDKPDEVLLGDVNGDGEVTDSDVTLLLWYTLFPEDYEIIGDADYNHDGSVTDEDVTILLWHTLFPEDYPLK